MQALETKYALREFDDYFATMATILNCTRENYEETGEKTVGRNYFR